MGLTGLENVKLSEDNRTGVDSSHPVIVYTLFYLDDTKCLLHSFFRIFFFNVDQF